MYGLARGRGSDRAQGAHGSRPEGQAGLMRIAKAVSHGQNRWLKVRELRAGARAGIGRTVANQNLFGELRIAGNACLPINRRRFRHPRGRVCVVAASQADRLAPGEGQMLRDSRVAPIVVAITSKENR
jgi:hypothetical protein